VGALETLTLIGLAFGAGLGQSVPDKPTFDVASVKRLPFDQLRGGLQREVTPIGVHLLRATIGNCLEWAYGKTAYEVVGPGWLDRPTDAVYEITAKTGSPVPEEQLKSMMQTLLEERFQLTFHRETRDLPVYALMVARNGPKLHKSETEGDPSVKPAGPYATKFERISMARLAFFLEVPFQPQHVADETGLQGTYDFTLDLARYIIDPATGQPIMDAMGHVDIRSAYYQGLSQQLGLRLERKRMPMEVLVIDHLEKDPTAN